MEQTKALNALEPFLALTKSATSPRAAADLIQRATSAPNTFVFAELLSTPQISSLSTNAEYKSHYTLLQIFSHGTYTDYISASAASSLPSLNAAQTLKLRQLSFLTLARNPNQLSYASLQKELGLGSERELEEVVVSAIYAGLVQATLDPYHHRVLISSVAPLRDLQPNSIPSMLAVLTEWSDRCSTSLVDLEKQIEGIKAQALQRAREEGEWKREVERLVDPKDDSKGRKGKSEEEKEGGHFSSLGRKLGIGNRKIVEDDSDDMDVDDEGEKPSNNKKRSYGLHASGR